MKKIIAICLSLMLALGAIGTAGATGETEKSELVIGSLTRMNGSFFTNMWGYNTADVDVRTLLHGYGTVAWTYNGEYALDETVVEDCTQLDTDEGRVYTFNIKPGLRYCDGTAITAKDFVFSVLLQSCNEVTELGGLAVSMNHIVGYENFREGGAFTGVRLIDEDTFTMTVKKESLPFYYELSLVAVTPYPMSVLAPECDILDNGQGASITGAFTAELLRTTILDEKTGYLTYPRVTSGAYMLEDYDAEKHIATFARNPYYQGNFEGKKPEFEKLTFKQVENSTMLDELKNGTVDIINKISVGDSILASQALVSNDEAQIMIYPRTGLNFLSFACEQPIGGDAAVRKAVAYATDSVALCADVMKGYATPSYGYYGLGQWMTQRDQEILHDTLDLYEIDLYAAENELDKGGWNLNEKGEAYVIDVDTLRYKLIDDQLTPLVINWARPEKNEISNAIQAQLEVNLPKIGVQLNVTEMPFDELIEYYYRQKDRSEFNMFQMGTNFGQVYDPYYVYNTADEYQGAMNPTAYHDEKLMQMALEMRSVEPEDNEGYYTKWLAFQQYYSSALPIVPLFSNVYADTYATGLYNYMPQSLWSWASAINYVTLTEPAPTEEATTVTFE